MGSPIASFVSLVLLTKLSLQCIVLATRPLLFCFLKMRLQPPDSGVEPPESSPTVRKLLQVCIDSAKQMLDILVSVSEQNLLGNWDACGLFGLC